MAGLYSIFSSIKEIPENNFNRFFSSNFEHTINEEFRGEDIIYGRSTINKFTNDRFLHEDDEVVLGIEGVIYNSSDPKKFILSKYKNSGLSFISELKGQFCGFIYDKKNRVFYAFTDPVSSKPLYYHINKSNKLFTLSSEGKFISSLLKDLNLSVNLDIDAIKSLLIMGFLLDDSMPITEIKKIPYGSILKIDLNTFELGIKPFFRLQKQSTNKSKKEVIEEMDFLLKSSVQNEWGKDNEYNYKHFSFLSGGLDSRVNLLLALELGFNEITTLNFAEIGTSDHKIASKISKRYHTNHNFNPLDGSYLLNDITEYIKANDGLAAFLGAAHLYSSVKNIDFSEYGSVHSGQIGDVLFGSFSSKGKISIENASKFGMVRDPLLTQRIDRLPKVLDRYDFEGSDEIFAFEQRQFNLTFNGDRTSSHFFDMTSPFYDKELIKYCLNIPPELKKGEAIYLDWFNKKLPQVSDFKWEKAGVKPTSLFKVEMGYQRKKILNKVYSFFDKQYDNMNPFTEWFSKSPALEQNFTKLFYENISVLPDKELKEIAILIFEKDNPISKMVAVSTLFTVKLYLNQLD
ncbi:MAG: hypothetical protein JXR11_01635 [Balneola sp.]